jgi:hypothetical protein
MAIKSNETEMGGWEMDVGCFGLALLCRPKLAASEPARSAHCWIEGCDDD